MGQRVSSGKMLNAPACPPTVDMRLATGQSNHPTDSHPRITTRTKTFPTTKVSLFQSCKWVARFLQGVNIACNAEPRISYDRDVRPSVRPSVRLSVTRWRWVKTTQAMITKSSPTDSQRTLVFGIKSSFRNSKEFTPSEGVKWEWGGKKSQFSADKSPYLRNGAR